MPVCRVGIIGVGTVGGGVLKALQQNANIIAQRTGVQFEVTSLASSKSRAALSHQYNLDDNVNISPDWKQVVYNDDVDIVLEVQFFNNILIICNLSSWVVQQPQKRCVFVFFLFHD